MRIDVLIKERRAIMSTFSFLHLSSLSFPDQLLPSSLLHGQKGEKEKKETQKKKKKKKEDDRKKRSTVYLPTLIFQDN